MSKGAFGALLGIFILIVTIFVVLSIWAAVDGVNLGQLVGGWFNPPVATDPGTDAGTTTTAIAAIKPALIAIKSIV